MRQDELAQRVVHREPVHAAPFHRQHQLRARAVHGEPARHELRPGQQEVLDGPLRAVFEPEDPEDGAHAYAGVKVAGAVDRVADDGVPRLGVLVEYDEVFLLFGDEEAASA